MTEQIQHAQASEQIVSQVGIMERLHRLGAGIRHFIAPGPVGGGFTPTEIERYAQFSEEFDRVNKERSAALSWHRTFAAQSNVRVVRDPRGGRLGGSEM